jgi:DNA-binding winged helix-turn-helix (wHTH) protein/tetratricopeptide (TPR) repeat protein
MVYRFGEFTLDDRVFEIRRNGIRLKVERRIFDLIKYLIENRDRVVSKSELLQQLWEGRKVTDASLTVAVAAARKLLADTQETSRLIETTHGRGYRFVGQLATNSLERSPGVHQDVFVGRTVELGALLESLERAARGNRQLCLISGEPGIGKSRLIREFLERATSSGTLVLAARCLEEEGASSFWPWTQIARQLVAATGGPLRLEDGVRREIARLAPEWALEGLVAGDADNDPNRARLRLFDAVEKLFTSASESGTIVLAIDDIHRADKASLLLLDYISAQLSRARLLIVLADRDAETSRSDLHRSVLANLCRAAAARALLLRGLAVEDIRALLNDRLGGRGAEVDAHALRDLTGGNPFFISQIVPLVGSGEGAPIAINAIPRTVRAAVELQLGGLSDEVRDVLAIASVLGRSFSSKVLARAVSDGGRAIEAVERAVEARVVEVTPLDDETLRFTHALVRDVLYDNVPVGLRAALHWRVAEAIEAHFGEFEQSVIPEIAFHMYRGVAAGDSEKALEYCRRAGALASARLAFEEAASQFRCALDLARDYRADDEILLGDLHSALGDELTRAGERDRARENFVAAAELARRNGDDARLARAALGSYPGFFALEAGAPDPVAIGLLEEALGRLEGATPLRALVLARLAMARAWLEEGRDRVGLTAEADEISRIHRDPALKLNVLAARWFAEWDPTDLDHRWEIGGELMEIARLLGDRESILLARLYFVTCLLERGDISEFRQQVAIFENAADKLRQPEAIWYAALLRACYSLHCGDLAEAEARSVQFERIGALVRDANVFHSRMTHRVIMSWESADYSQLVAVTSAAFEAFPAVVGWRAARAWSLMQAERLAEARREFEAVLRVGLDRIPRRMDWAVTMAFLADLTCVLRRHDTAESLLSMLAPLRGRTILLGLCVASWGCASRYLGKLAGLLGRFDEAESLLEEAIAVEDRVGARAWAARSRYELALVLREQELNGSPGMRDRICSLRSEAGAIAASLGLNDLERRLAKLA